MGSENLDVAIIGGGSAGLALAYHYSLQTSKSAKVTIFERRREYTNDRTWGFWDFAELEENLHRIIRKKWQKWHFSSENEEEIQQSMSHPYCALRSGDYYSEVLQAISADSLVDLQLGCRVNDVRKEGGHFILSTENGEVKAGTVIDTRPPLENYHYPHCSNSIPHTTFPGATLYQVFYGIEVETEEKLFDESLAQVMAGMICQDDSLAFLYLLPYSPQRALFEYTVFSTQPVKWESLKEPCLAKIEEISTGNFPEIVHEEGAILPMGDVGQVSEDDGHYFAGICGGSLRASTGYAFIRTQRWAKACASHLAQHGIPSPMRCDSSLRKWMDAVFLRVIRAQPELAPGLFMALAREMDGDAFARFMMEKATIGDTLRVIRSMPTAPFLKELRW